MRTVPRCAWWPCAVALGGLAVPVGCGPTDVVKPPDVRHKEAEATRVPPPPRMKKQESFDPRKALREKSGTPAP